MAHPYRLQLASNKDGELAAPVDLQRAATGAKAHRGGDPILPHRILAQHQNTSRKPHPFLQQLPDDLSRSLESLHVTSPQRTGFDGDSIPSPRGSTTSNSPQSSFHIHSNTTSKANSQTNLATQTETQSSPQSQSQSHSHLSKAKVNNSIREMIQKNDKRAPSDTSSDLSKMVPRLPKIRLEKKTEEEIPHHNFQGNTLSSFDINDYTSTSLTTPSKNMVPTSESGEKSKDSSSREQKYNEDKAAIGDIYGKHGQTKSVANLIHPIYDISVADVSTDASKTEAKSNSNLKSEPQPQPQPQTQPQHQHQHQLQPQLQQKTQQTTEAEPNTPSPKQVSTDVITHTPESQKQLFNERTSVNLLPPEKSIDMYRENAKKTKNPEVLFSFAKILIRTSLLKRADNQLSEKEKNAYLDEAHTALKKAAKAGYVEAQYYLGDAFSVGLFNKGRPDMSKSLTYFETAAKCRHSESAYRTAMCYKKGWGCTRDARKVLKYLEIAAMNNHPVAMMEYGIYAFHGLMSFPEDVNTKQKGISWLRRATECATELSCAAPYELALIYINGFKDIVIKDTTYALRLLFQASSLGHAKSSAMLGRFYEIGDVVEANPDLSIHFYNVAAMQGDVDGMMGLCSWYFVGSEHLPQDYDEAYAWALKAAEKLKHVKAMLLLERFLQMGIGCEKNEAKAKYWGDLARAQTGKKK